MIPGLTLKQRYYGINKAIIDYLALNNIDCKVLKYGIDPATLKDQSKDQNVSIYPFIRTHLRNPKPVAWTTKESGTMTEFDFHVSFFTSPEDEFLNDENLFIPFEVVKNAFSDIDLKLFSYTTPNGDQTTIADLLSIIYDEEFFMNSGQPSPANFFIAKMRAVCGYGITTPDSTFLTDLDQIFNFTWSN